jgi:hypothetical protein
MKKGRKPFASPPPQIIYYRIQREMKKMDTQFRIPTKQRKTMPRNPTLPARTPSKRNPASNH